MKEERVYLLSTAGRDAIYIKIGCTSDMRARMKSYDCNNPIYNCHGSFCVPDRQCSESIEDALLRLMSDKRHMRTEWYKVNTQIYMEFIELKSLTQVLAFTHWEDFIKENIDVSSMRLLEADVKSSIKKYREKVERYTEISRRMPK